jgi:basic amino acid/polyamine antiporter, APA family
MLDNLTLPTIEDVDHLLAIWFCNPDVSARRFFWKEAVIRHIECALLSSLSSLVMVGPRVTQVMGEDLTALRVFAKRNARGVPVRAIVLQSSIALFLVVTSTFEVVHTYVGFLLAFFAWMTLPGVFVARVKKPQAKRPFKTWGCPVTPAVFLLLNGWMLCYLVIERPPPSLGGMITVACGLLFYRLFATRQFTKTGG